MKLRNPTKIVELGDGFWKKKNKAETYLFQIPRKLQAGRKKQGMKIRDEKDVTMDSLKFKKNHKEILLSYMSIKP